MPSCFCSGHDVRNKFLVRVAKTRPSEIYLTWQVNRLAPAMNKEAALWLYSHTGNLTKMAATMVLHGYVVLIHFSQPVGRLPFRFEHLLPPIYILVRKVIYTMLFGYTQGHSEGIFFGGGGAELHYSQTGPKQLITNKLGKSSVLRTTIHSQSANPCSRLCRLKIYSRPTLVLVPLMLHLPIGAINAAWRNVVGGVTPPPYTHTLLATALCALYWTPITSCNDSQ